MKTQHGLTIGNLNVCHLKNKIDDVNVLINGHQDKVHIFGISETRLDEDIDDSIIQINNYSSSQFFSPISIPLGSFYEK